MPDGYQSRIEVTHPMGCWWWTGATTWAGYGHAKIGGRTQLVHRVIYELLVGPVPKGLELDHLCTNKACVNPDHLEPVTPSENQRRAYYTRHGDRCQRGHLDWRVGKTQRTCRTCQRMSNAT